MIPSDQQLLTDFAKNDSEAAFRALSQRYLGLILNTARRRTGNSTLAQDVSQRVLCILAKKAGPLSRQTRALGPWLHRTTLYEASKVMRSESSYQKKKSLLQAEIQATPTATKTNHRDALPLLDQALDHLPATDREILLLHYFEGLSFEQIASKVGKSLSATQKRSQRALQKVSAILQRKGVTLSLTALASLLGSELSQGASPALVQALTAKSLNTAQTGSSMLSFSPLLLGGLATVAVLAPILYQEKQISQTRQELAQASLVTHASASTKSTTNVPSPRTTRTKPSSPDLSLLEPFALAKAYYAAQKEKGFEGEKFHAYLRNLSEEELHQLLLACTSPDLAPRYQRPFISALVREYSAKNPKLVCQTLVDLAQETPPRDFRSDIDNQIERWTAQNPKEATAWIKEQIAAETLGSLTGEDHHWLIERILTNHFTQLIKDHPQDALDLLAEIPASARGDIIGRAFNSSYNNNNENTVQLDRTEYGLSLAELLPLEERPQIIGSLTSRSFLDSETPTLGLQALLAHPELKKEDRETVLKVGAAYLVNDIKNSNFRFRSQETLLDFETWLLRETAEAPTYIGAALVGSRPTEPTLRYWADHRPSVLSSYLQNKQSERYLTESDESLTESIHLAESIPDQTQRQETLRHLQTLKEQKEATIKK